MSVRRLRELTFTHVPAYVRRQPALLQLLNWRLSASATTAPFSFTGKKGEKIDGEIRKRGLLHLAVWIVWMDGLVLMLAGWMDSWVKAK